MNLKQHQRKKEIAEMATEAAKRSVAEIMGEMNKFNVNDKVIWIVDMSDLWDMNAIYEIKEHSHGQFKVFLGEEFVCWCGDRVFDQEFRHATKSEIAKGYRIGFEVLEHPENHISRNCKVINND